MLLWEKSVTEILVKKNEILYNYTSQGRIKEFVMGGLTFFFFFPRGSLAPVGPENSLKSIYFSGPGGLPEGPKIYR